MYSINTLDLVFITAFNIRGNTGKTQVTMETVKTESELFLNGKLPCLSIGHNICNNIFFMNDTVTLSKLLAKAFQTLHHLLESSMIY